MKKYLAIIILTVAWTYPPIPAVRQVSDANINIVLPPPQPKIVMFEYPIGIDKTKYNWYIEASQRGDYWFSIAGLNNMDSNRIVTVKALYESLTYRVKGVPK